jgi:hypothetical protein
MSSDMTAESGAKLLMATVRPESVSLISTVEVADSVD